jgi:hypothetical protein
MHKYYIIYIARERLGAGKRAGGGAGPGGGGGGAGRVTKPGGVKATLYLTILYKVFKGGGGRTKKQNPNHDQRLYDL